MSRARDFESLAEVVARLEAGTPPPPDAGLFGADPRPEECALELIPVPFDGTASYGKGTSLGPEAIVRASHQLDLEDPTFDRPYRAGIAMELGDAALARLEAPEEKIPELQERILETVRARARKILDGGRIAAVIGGEHSVPLGLLKALDEQATKAGESFGVLHVDAHFDLRQAYEGFEQSHASIMYNVLATCPRVERIVHVGIRDYSREEWERHLGSAGRTVAFLDQDLGRREALGETWAATVKEILASLPEKVYVSFDIDGLDPALCPGTGTPVPGGLSYRQATYLLDELARSGRRIIGFDLCEVAPGKGEWDANVGARILYKLCGATLFSNGRCGLVAEPS